MEDREDAGRSGRRDPVRPRAGQRISGGDEILALVPAEALQRTQRLTIVGRIPKNVGTARGFLSRQRKDRI
jgi:hypothetical protein